MGSGVLQGVLSAGLGFTMDGRRRVRSTSQQLRNRARQTELSVANTRHVRETAPQVSMVGREEGPLQSCIKIYSASS